MSHTHPDRHPLLVATLIIAVVLAITGFARSGIASTTIDLNITTGGNLTVSGSVGIGTTTPYSILSISNSATTAVNTPLFTIASTTAGTATSTLMTVLANGSVGIGTASPTYRLTVNSDNSTDNLLQVSTTTNQTIFTVDSTGKVGIGRVPGSQFKTYIKGAADVSTLLLQTDLGADATTFNRIIGFDNLAGSIEYATFNVSSNTFKLAASNSLTKFAFQTFNGDYSFLAGGSGTTDMFYINGTTGSVGIGTTTPTAQLQVTNSSSNATTSVEIGKTGQNKGSCLKMYDEVGTVKYVTIRAGSFAISDISCL